MQWNTLRSLQLWHCGASPLQRAEWEDPEHPEDGSWTRFGAPGRPLKVLRSHGGFSAGVDLGRCSPPETVSENQVSKYGVFALHAEGALLLALAEAAAGVPVAGGFFRDSVGGFAANIVEPDPKLA